MDASPEWSRDGKWIAFHRRQRSADGPAGLYVVPSAGGAVRWVAPGDFFWPTQIHFSPDSRRLVYVSGLQLLMADVESATSWVLVHTDFGVTHADWSPGGRFIAYWRAVDPGLDTPADSLGLHILDLVSGQDSVVRSTVPGHPPVYYARIPLWSRDERQIAFLEGRVDGDNVVAVRPDGSGYTMLSRSPTGAAYDYLHWYTRPSKGIEGLAFWQVTGDGAGPRFVNRDGSGARVFERAFTPHDAFSPDGELVVTPGIDASDTAEVLYVERFDDRIGISRRQLTFWHKPAGAAAIAVDARIGALPPINRALIPRSH